MRSRRRSRGDDGEATGHERPAGLLSILLKAATFAFVLFLAYRFLAEVASVAFSLAAVVFLGGQPSSGSAPSCSCPPPPVRSTASSPRSPPP